ncbi:hydantoinase/oxoprolinase family protein [Salinicola rhizosphaerae]|uniref:N-methylhydantoinase A n=1 Tax=Salinicola rhizosphaerae TaxID=1443141 RepID=A0ABQ3DQV3_9GAMM|nr:hydantoinase/oxoprolinase family protein [Salinicola rhizosphaerae]GHB11186.1 N-methylhydantoinase A [Salinicola rhizosphaerae]
MTTNTRSARAGADIGGTFTDIALEVDGQLHSAKTLTQYAAPEQAVVDGLLRTLDQAGVAPDQLESLVHGTTLATNALIERRGAHTAFITTEGFRDVIEMRTESRFEQYDLNIVLPTPLIARQHRYTVGGRMSAEGQELIPLDDAALEAIIDAIEAKAYVSVAIGLMHSYRNAAHERRIRDRLQARLPHLSVSLSSEVSPQIREYERFNTVCANAFVKPLMSSYLGRLASGLEARGITCPVYLMHSGGGLMSLASAAEFPVRLLESGPAGGAIYAADIAARYGLDRVLSYDMGGTTAKICLIQDQRPQTARTFEVARTYRFKKGSGMPISIPVIEMVEIGAGGGSLAHVDDLHQIRVGPESAGSEPGPACYGRGGTAPAVTDADLILGRLDAENFAGGSFRLHRQAAEDALHRTITAPLGGDLIEAAYGIVEVVDENMANAARVHAVESGRELDQYTMIAYGGAAPLHAARICEKLGIDRLVVPPGAGVGSAIGFLRAPFGYESLRSAVMQLATFDLATVNDLLADMSREVSTFINETGYRGEVEREFKAYMRYAGQGWEIPVAVARGELDERDVADLHRGFVTAYAQIFGHAIDNLDAEVVSWSLSLRTPIAPVEPRQFGKAPPNERNIESRDMRAIFDARHGQFRDSQVIERRAMPVGNSIHGPAVIIEPETSTIVPAGFDVTRQADDCLFIERLKETAE